MEKKPYNVNLESLKGGSKHHRHLEYSIYTDSTKNNEGTGGRFVVYHYKKNHIQTVQDHTTVYQVELQAIYQA